MIWIILAVILVVALIADGLGISFWIVILVGGGIFLLVCGLIPNEKDSEEKAKKKKLVIKGLIIAVAVAAVVGIIAGIVGVVGNISSSSSSADSEYDDVMAGQDWGDGYYYDSGDNAVKKTPW